MRLAWAATLVMTLALLSSCTSDEPPIEHTVTLDEATALVLNRVLQLGPEPSVLYTTRPNGYLYCSVRYLPRILAAGEEVIHDGDSGSRFRHSVPYDSWFFYIDDRPIMCYHHECRYVFIDATRSGHMEVFWTRWGFPPVRYQDMVDLDMTRFKFRSYEEEGWDDWVPRGPQPN